MTRSAESPSTAHAAVGLASRPCQIGDVGEYAVLDEAVVYAPRTKTACSLNGPAKAIWELCDGEHTVAGIAEELARRLGRSPDQLVPELVSDVTAAVAQFHQLGLVVLAEGAPSRPPHAFPEWYAQDNGFKAPLYMEKAHEPIVKLAVATLAGRGGNVLDLGCGNGALLKKVYQANPAIVPFGIDRDARRIEHAGLLLPEFAGNFIAGDMFEDGRLSSDERNYALTILDVARLLEPAPEKATRLKQKVKENSQQLLVYAYDDWLLHQTLHDLARQAGVLLAASGVDTSLSLASIQ
jgi:hypothetical protein